jgi:HlyD family secretion protein
MMDAQDARVKFEIKQAQGIFDAQAAIRTAERNLATAQKVLSDAQAGGNALDIANAKLTVREAEVGLEQAHSDRADLDAGADPTELATAQADVERKKLAVQEAETALAATELKAPFDGTILETNVRAGDQITDSTLVLTVADLTDLQVFAFVDETTIRRIQEGQEAQISFDAFPGQSFKGKVLAVPLQGSLQNDVMVYQVPISLEGADELDLRVGMTANVEVQTARADNALLVPAIALQRNRGQYIQTPVEVGLSDGTFTQIVQGLNAGDQVLVTVQASNNTNSPFGQFRVGAAPVFGIPGGAGPAIRIERAPGGGGQNRSGQ